MEVVNLLRDVNLIALIDLTIFVTVFNTENVPLITKHWQVQLKNSCLTRNTIL